MTTSTAQAKLGGGLEEEGQEVKTGGGYIEETQREWGREGGSRESVGGIPRTYSS